MALWPLYLGWYNLFALSFNGITRSMFIFTLFALFSPTLLAQPIAVIVHEANTASDLSTADLTRIYTGVKRNWEDGQNIFLLDHSAVSQTRAHFYKSALNAAPAETFYVPGTPVPLRPMVVDADNAMVAFVSNTPNAIGYVSFNTSLLANKGIKLLKINGVLPGEPHYPLE